ncbi:MAG: ThuA domain-containing protein [Dehalococcoidia bacterium]|nr:ThuA domain-containing protein [Dehalococcoidia bacterium]
MSHYSKSSEAIETLIVHKGHNFNYSGFFAMFDENPEVNSTAVEQPAAQVMLRPENVQPYETIVFYDMLAIDGSPIPEDYKASIEALIESGKGIVMMNHATLQWPAWEGWREISGSSFRLGGEGEVFGEIVPASGYRGGGGEPERNGHHHLSPVQQGHPVLEGLEDGFDIVDEIYIKTKGFESRPGILPLMRSDYPMVKENFNAPVASAEERAKWDHPEGSDLIVWANKAGNSPVVAMDAGDGPEAYANPQFRRLLNNAIHWVASDNARAWVQSG